MVFVNNTRQRVVSMVGDTTMVKNVAKYVLSLLHLVEFGVLVVGISFDQNHVVEDSRKSSEWHRVQINENRKRVCN